MPNVSPIENVNYTLSLATDPLSGPYSLTVNTTAGVTLTCQLIQVTAGPSSSVVVSFGDGSVNQTFSSIVVSTPVNISHNYTTAGTFTISVAVTLTGLTGVNTTVNTITAYVAGPPVYPSKKSQNIQTKP